MRAVSHAAVFAMALTAAGCSSCNDGSVVPFGLDAGRRDEAPVDDEPSPAHRPVGRTFEEGTHRVQVEGAELAVEDGSLRALWAGDVDADGDRDALMITSGPPSAPIQVLYAQRNGSSFAAPRPLGRAPAAPEGCSIASAELAPLGDRWLSARARLACEERPSAAREEVWVVDAGVTPRALEHLALLASDGRAPGEVRLDLSTADRDGDQRDDLVVTVSVDRGGEPSRLELPWLDRPSGLARDVDEPESTLSERSRAALRDILRNRVEPGLSSSRDVLALHEVLCREPGRARLRVGDTEGLSCGTSDGAGRAATTVVRALARQGEWVEALDALQRMDTPGLLINPERREYAWRAIAEAPASPNVRLREGPEHRAPAAETARASALGFLDEDHVILRGMQPRVWDLASGQVEAYEPRRSDLRLLDPSGQYAVAGIERRCEGHVLMIVPAASLVSGSVFGLAHSTPLLEPREPPAGAPCPDLTPALRRDDGGWRVLGWAPQGVVAARGATLRVVPLDLSAQPAGEPEELGAGTPPPAPLPPGPASPDGRFHAEVRGLGVILHRVTPQPESTVLWPEGWAARQGQPTDPAASPSGRRVVVLRGGRVLLLERSGD